MSIPSWMPLRGEFVTAGGVPGDWTLVRVPATWQPRPASVFVSTETVD
jgi:hypothetical protein